MASCTPVAEGNAERVEGQHVEAPAVPHAPVPRGSFGETRLSGALGLPRGWTTRKPLHRCSLDGQRQTACMQRASLRWQVLATHSLKLGRTCWKEHSQISTIEERMAQR